MKIFARWTKSAMVAAFRLPHCAAKPDSELTEGAAASGGRRRFLRSSLLAGGAAAMLPAAAGAKGESGGGRASEGARGYRMTAHVRRYYESVRRV